MLSIRKAYLDYPSFWFDVYNTANTINTSPLKPTMSSRRQSVLVPLPNRTKTDNEKTMKISSRRASMAITATRSSNQMAPPLTFSSIGMN